MFGMDIAPAIVAGVLAYSIVLTLVTNWMVAGAKRPAFPPRFTPRLMWDLLANLIWIALMVIFGVLAVRYIERMRNAVVGYLLFATLGCILSLLRAHLYRRVQKQRQPERAADRQALASILVHNLSYLLLAIVLYLALAWVLHTPLEPTLFIPLWIGALAPDLDDQESLLGRLLPGISRRLESRMKRLGKWHTLAAAALVALITSPLSLLFGVEAWYLIPIGFTAHLLVDLLAPEGIMLLWPLNRVRYTVFGAVVESPGSRSERALVVALALTAIILCFAVDRNTAEEAIQVSTPSYQETLERYYSWRGRIQVFAQIYGSWQTSGRPIAGRFEILNASDGSYILLDRFGDKVFAAGRTSADNVYLDRIVLQSGPAVTVKPLEIHLEQQPLSDALEAVYEMQSEPGLQHILVSGELVLPTEKGVDGSSVQADHSLTSLRKIQEHGGQVYSLRFLTAAELIYLADLRVEEAHLVIVATYLSSASGATATPLPAYSLP